jgi:hypothetical protein
VRSSRAIREATAGDITEYRFSERSESFGVSHFFSELPPPLHPHLQRVTRPCNSLQYRVLRIGATKRRGKMLGCKRRCGRKPSTLYSLHERQPILHAVFAPFQLRTTPSLSFCFLSSRSAPKFLADANHTTQAYAHILRESSHRRFDASAAGQAPPAERVKTCVCDLASMRMIRRHHIR